MPEFDVPEIRRTLPDNIKTVGREIESVHGKYWESRISVAKTILTLSSAVLGGTIVFYQLMAPKIPVHSLTWWFLVSAWVFFAASLVSATYAMWHLYELQSIHPRLYYAKGKIVERVENYPPAETDEHLLSVLNQIFLEETAKVIDEVSLHDRRSHLALGVQLVLFGIGMTLFVVFGLLVVV